MDIPRVALRFAQGGFIADTARFVYRASLFRPFQADPRLVIYVTDESLFGWIRQFARLTNILAHQGLGRGWYTAAQLSR